MKLFPSGDTDCSDRLMGRGIIEGRQLAKTAWDALTKEDQAALVARVESQDGLRQSLGEVAVQPKYAEQPETPVPNQRPEAQPLNGYRILPGQIS